MRVMRLVRALRPDLAPAEAKALVDAPPGVVLAAVGYWDVAAMRRRFEREGAEVEFIDNAAP